MVAGRSALAMAAGMGVLGAAAWINAGPAGPGFLFGAGVCLLAALGAAILGPHLSLKRLSSEGLGGMLYFWTLAPLLAAIPLWLTVGGLGYQGAYFEAVSALTTTGASLIDPAEAPPEALLWRAMCGWGGGLFMLRAAVAVYARLHIGGYEVDALPRSALRERTAEGAISRRAQDALAGLYIGLTAAVAALLALGGESAFEAACLAMGAVSATGFPVEGGSAAVGGPAEIVLMLAMLTAILGVRHRLALTRGAFGALGRGGELQAAGVILSAAVALLVLRHWLRLETGETSQGGLAEAFWGALFMAVSFLSTTGYYSASWADTLLWSGQDAAALLLLSLAMIGGGAASTAGGVKLIRVVMVTRHSQRELARLAFPNSLPTVSIAGARTPERSLRVLWLFMMLYFSALAAVGLLMAGLGADFQGAFVAAVAALSNTGPALALAPELTYAEMSGGQRTVLILAMVAGRMETLTVVALMAVWLRR